MDTMEEILAALLRIEKLLTPPPDGAAAATISGGRPAPRAGYKPWTEDDWAELVRLAAAGVSRDEMAAALGRSPNAIKMRLEKDNIDVVRAWDYHEDEVVRNLPETLSNTEMSQFRKTLGRSAAQIYARQAYLKRSDR